ncbi:MULTISPECIES: glutaredoxin family protein [unclassified Undibacterium]|uniref:glutaredoxin family protein n=1 Tax=unclassified Undibacterium TaxID=2630295 RepID=UPI002AC8D3CA|nr:MULTISPECIES: glutaredoxin family protein [unclassified Undibacterium]MEB0138149.1 glutaredoxin family protein [Undibacterium sp. CCC2.1]MEB0171096.1 glutaredoxin family protein [Undibacterium sp. CCC1.1]MEB0175141.1 glutaredoxin family protein [Undibacterium sp. CCC3.4]MEB0214275.1 glutaredoxin family protein [Undibacterium sp. 5I2]WPX41855.1 glutaredoxin family protein [Undibacterium sp. CCC3.4]
MPRHTLMLIGSLSALLLSAATQAEVYKSVGPDGSVTYSDTPPPPGRVLLEKKSLPNAEANPGFSYELALAASTQPVILYSMANCPPCVDGAKLLKAAGIPFLEQTISTPPEQERLKQLGGDSQLPFLTIGSKKLHAFNPDEWKAALKLAGYPAANRLPADYRYPAPQRLLPAGPSAASGNSNSKSNSKSNNPPPTAAPKPGTDHDFRF